MRKIPFISIIMPVYNAKLFVKKSIESILNQDFDDFELILVDDGSCDGSASICDEFARLDSRVVLLHQNNMGTSSARNAGLKIAKGKYITFCDHDDEYASGMLKSNYEVAKKYDADVVCCSVRIIYPHGKGSFIHTMSLPTKVYGPESSCELVKELKYDNNTLFGYVWNHWYRRDVVEKLQFETKFKHGHEDQVFNLCVVDRLKGNFVFNSSTFYQHYSRPNSSSKTYDRKSDKTIQETLLLFDYEYNFALKYQECSLSNGGHVLVADLYVLYNRCNLKNRRELNILRNCNYIKQYPLSLHADEKLLLFCFRHVYPLFKILCGMEWARYNPGEKEMILSTKELNFWETPLCGFFLNLYESKRGRWMFVLCNTLIRIFLIPFNLLK